MPISTILVIFGLIAEFIAAINVPCPVNLTAAGLFCFGLAWLAGG